MKQHSMLKQNFQLLVAAAMLSGFMIGCSSPHSVGIQIGESERPYYPVVHKQPGPPSHAPAHGYRKKFAYQYYPTANVYYDQSRRVYFYLSGREWEMAVSLPSSLRIDVQEAVSLELETDRPYMENDKHIKQVKYKEKGPKWKR